jgi:hypothetical protein
MSANSNVTPLVPILLKRKQPNVPDTSGDVDPPGDSNIAVVTQKPQSKNTLEAAFDLIRAQKKELGLLKEANETQAKKLKVMNARMKPIDGGGDGKGMIASAYFGYKFLSHHFKDEMKDYGDKVKDDLILEKEKKQDEERKKKNQDTAPLPSEEDSS